MRAVIGRPAVIRARFLNSAGVLADPSPAPLVTVRRPDGTAIVTGVQAVTEGVGIWKHTLAAQTQLDVLTATFSGTLEGATVTVTEECEVVGRRLVDLWRLREEDTTLAALTVEKLERILERVETTFEDGLGFPPVPRSERAVVIGSGGPRLTIPGVRFPLELYTLTEDGTAVTVGDVSDSYGWFEKTSGAAWIYGRSVVAWLTHGWTQPPEDVVGAAIVYARYLAKQPGAGIPSRATSITTEESIITLSMPSPDRPTGLPEVDAVLARHAFRSPI